MKQTAHDKLRTAQARIAALEAKLRRAETGWCHLFAALKPFAKAGAEIPSHWSDATPAVKWKAGEHPWFMTVADFRRAAEAAQKVADEAERI